VSEEFRCLPSAAVRELEEDPSQIALDVIEVREYARCKDAFETPEKDGKREKALEPYYVEGDPKPILRTVEANATELFKERNPHIRMGHSKK
jgi:hypothetical protein